MRIKPVSQLLCCEQRIGLSKRSIGCWINKSKRCRNNILVQIYTSLKSVICPKKSDNQIILKWAASWQNQHDCAPSKDSDDLKSAWASAQSDQSSLSAWRKLVSLATHWAHPGWSESSLGDQWFLSGTIDFLFSWFSKPTDFYVQSKQMICKASTGTTRTSQTAFVLVLRTCCGSVINKNPVLSWGSSNLKSVIFSYSIASKRCRWNGSQCRSWSDCLSENFAPLCYLSSDTYFILWWQLSTNQPRRLTKSSITDLPVRARSQYQRQLNKQRLWQDYLT